MGNRSPSFHLEQSWILLQCKKAGKRAGIIHRSRIGPDCSGLCSFQVGLGFSPPFLPGGGCRWGRSRLCKWSWAALPGVVPATGAGSGVWAAPPGLFPPGAAVDKHPPSLQPLGEDTGQRSGAAPPGETSRWPLGHPPPFPGIKGPTRREPGAKGSRE